MSEALTEDLIRNRPKLLGLARQEFERTEMSAMKAFSQFQASADIVNLINARRDGLFDYAVCVRATDTGWAWPQKDVVLDALTKALAKTLTPDDMPGLGLTPNDFAALTMGSVTTEASTADETSETSETDEKTTDTTDTTETGEKTTTVAEKETTAMQHAPTMPERLENVTDNVTAAVNRGNTRILTALRGLFGMLETVYTRQTILADRSVMILTYLDENAEVGDDMPKFDPGCIADVTAALSNLPDLDSNDNDEDDEVVETKPVATVKPSVPAAVPAKAVAAPSKPLPPPAPKPNPTPKPAAAEGRKQYSEEELKGLDVADLIQVAEAWGVPNASQLSYKAVIIRKIKQAGGVVDVAA